MELVTSIVSTAELSDVLYIIKLPVSTSTASEKVKTILLSVATAVASSAGENDVIVGAVESRNIVLSLKDNFSRPLTSNLKRPSLFFVIVAVPSWLFVTMNSL